MGKIQINEDLTPETASEFRLEWIKDIPQTDYDSSKADNAFFFGHPKNLDHNYLGIYQKIWLLPIDYKLTPNNAAERGYEWVADVYYDPEAPADINENVIKDYHDGYLFGEAACIAIMENGFVGKYQKISNK